MIPYIYIEQNINSLIETLKFSIFLVVVVVVVQTWSEFFLKGLKKYFHLFCDSDSQNFFDKKKELKNKSHNPTIRIEIRVTKSVTILLSLHLTLSTTHTRIPFQIRWHYISHRNFFSFKVITFVLNFWFLFKYHYDRIENRENV